MLGEEEVKDERFAPLDDALDDVQRQHPQRVQDVDALFQEGGAHIAFAGGDGINHLAEFVDLRDAGLAGNDGSDGRLDRCLFLLEVFDFFGDDGGVLSWVQPVDTVEEDGAVVVRHQICLPGL